jgi:integrase
MQKRKGSSVRKGLYKRGNRWWCYVDPVEGGRVSTGAKTLEGAQEWLRERERRAANPAYSASHTETLGKWVKRMLADKQQLSSPSTLDFYTEKSGHLLRLFGEHCPLVSINADAVDRYKNQRFEEGAAHYTISKEFTALRQTLKKAARAEVYAGDLSTLFPLDFGHGYKPREQVLSLEVEAELKRLLPPHQWGAVAFILATSARLGEMLRAQPGDWDKERGTVLLRGTKTESSHRVIPVVSVMVPYLEAAEPFMPFDFASITQKLTKVSKRLGVQRITANDLRRTCSTRLIEGGADPYHVSRITGHTDLQMLRRVYDRSRVDATGEALEGQLAARAAARAARKVGTETAQHAESSIKTPEENAENARISNPRVGVSNTSGRAKNSSNSAVSLKRVSEGTRVLPGPSDSLGTETAQFPASVWALAEVANRLGLLTREAA